MYDSFHRNIDYMRISITDRCNLRCRYCMPHGVELISMEDILRYEEIVEVCKEAVKLGIRKFKITGGEPLVRRGCSSLIAAIKALPGVEQVTLTTNGILLREYLPQLLEAGIDGINISLDTLQEDTFFHITAFDQLGEVLEGIKASVEAGIPVKINAVLQKGINENEWKSLLEMAKEQKLDVRFIELMPVGAGRDQEMISNQWLMDQIRKDYPDVMADERVHGNGPATYYRIPGFLGSVGFISAIHGKFCAGCNRIRMTSTGEIKPCLCYETGYSVRDAVRDHRMDEVGLILREAISNKPQMHCFEEVSQITEQKKMVQIGG